MVGILAQVDDTLAGRVAHGLGINVPAKLDSHLNQSIPADGDVKQLSTETGQNLLETFTSLEYGEHRQGQHQDP